MKKKFTTLHFHHGKLKFAAGHFTVFSKTTRETLHGHNYTLDVTVKAALNEVGIVADYRLLEQKFVALCQQLNWFFLAPAKSPYVEIKEDGEHYEIIFNNKSMWLLKTDVVLLPLENITLETLSQWFVDQIMADKDYLKKHGISGVSVRINNGPYHGAECCG